MQIAGESALWKIKEPCAHHFFHYVYISWLLFCLLMNYMFQANCCHELEYRCCNIWEWVPELGLHEDI